MKVVKIIESTPLRNDEDWYLFIQALIGSSYVYGAVVCETAAEASAIKEGQHLDIEKTKFVRRSTPTI
jgi:hypothetical protein